MPAKAKPAPTIKRHLIARRFKGIAPQYRDELCFYILSELGDGRSLGDICTEPGMPSPGIVAAWALRDPDFAKLYIHARRKRAIVYAEEIIKIADDDTADDKTKIARDVLRIKSRQWVIERDLPELFGEFKERELKPLPVLNATAATNAAPQISNDPSLAAKEYSRIMGAQAAGAAFVANVDGGSTIDEDGSQLGQDGTPIPDVEGYDDEDVLFNCDPLYEPHPEDTVTLPEEPPFVDRPKLAEYYDPKRPPAEEIDDVLPD